jgi:membrane protein implicated in regulation of membrane protease activity
MSALTWLVIAIVLLVIEMVTPGIFFFACFSVGAFAATLAAFLGCPFWAIWVIFFSVSILLIFLVAPFARRWMKKIPPTPVGLDSLEGQRAQVIEPIDPGTGKGQVRLSNGAIWRAMSDLPITEGSQVEIVCITGTRLQVNPSSEAAASKEQP